MKRVTLVVLTGMLLCALIALPASSAMAECGKQGTFALAIAQLLGFEVMEVEEAIEALDSVGVSESIWDPEACVEETIVQRVDKALKRAVSTGLLQEDDVIGIIEAALESIGEESLIYVLRQGMPDGFFDRGKTLKGGYPLEGARERPEREREREPPPGDDEPPPDREDRTEASPFVP